MTAAEKNLLDLAGAPNLLQSGTHVAAGSESSESRTADKMATNKPRQVSSDSFASLAGLMKSKKAWAIPPKPLVPVANDRSTPTSLGDSASTTVTPACDYPALRTASADAAASGQVPHWASEGKRHLETLVSSEPTPTKNHGYDKAAMSKMDDLIAEMSKMDTEALPEWEVIPNQPMGAQLEHRVESPSQTLVGIDTASSSPVQGHVSPPRSETPAFGLLTTEDKLIPRYKDHESAFHLSVDEPMIRCTPQVWDTVIDQMATLKRENMEAQATLKREKMEAQTKLASLERDWTQRHQAKGDCSTELDELRYRLQVNKDHKAMMHRDMRQKEAEVLIKDLENESLKKQIADLDNMRERCEKLQAEADYLRTEIDKTEADNGQLKQIIIFKEQEVGELKESLARSKTKVTDHQQRADNLVDTQNAREKKLKKFEKLLRDAQDTEEKLLDEIQPLKKQAKDLDSQLREKTSSCDRMRNDLKHTEKRLEVASKALYKIENHQQLKGAAHLIIPSDHTKLPRLVLPCIECFARNVTCDSNSRCQNCNMSDERCHRWKCSQMHILRAGCQDFMCPLEHDDNGWLMLKQEQPQW
ncbi:hypothetical protein PMIN03_003017 [Paraphaeosphaeria minitans]